MFEKFLSVNKLKISEKSVWDGIFKRNNEKVFADEEKLDLKLRPKEKYGILDIYYYGSVETKDSENYLRIVLVKFSNESIFLDSSDSTDEDEDSVSLNNLIGALRKTVRFNVLFVFELDKQEKFKLCYHPLEFNKIDIKAGISRLDARINYDYSGVSITPWVHLDAQSRRIKTALSKLNDLFEQAAKMETDEFYLQVEEILKGISSDEIISVLTQEPISEKYRLSPKRLFAGLDKFDASSCVSHFNLEKSLLENIPTISVKGNYHDVYEKVDVEDFWHFLHCNGVEEEDLSDCSYFKKDILQESVATTADENPPIENDEKTSNVISFTSFKDLPEDEYNKIREAAERIESYEILDGEKMELYNGSEFFLDLNVRQAVTFYEAMYLCNKKSIQDGLNPCYEFFNPKIDHNELVFDVSEIDENGYRLPMYGEIEELLRNESMINKSRLYGKIKILSGELYKETVITDDETEPKKYNILNFLPEAQLIEVEKFRKDEEQQYEEFGEQWLYRVLAFGQKLYTSQKLYTKLCSNARTAFLQMVKNVPESDATKYRNVQNDLTNYLDKLASIRRKSDLSNFKNQTETQKSKKILWQPRDFLPAQAFLRTSEKQKESIILSDDCIPKKKNTDRKPDSFPKKQVKIEYSQEQIAALKNRLKEISEQKESLESKMGECNDVGLFYAYEKQHDELSCEYQDIQGKLRKFSRNI